jgi:DNA replication protein DnaC
MSGSQFEVSNLLGLQRRANPAVVFVLRQEMPDDHCQLAGDRNRCNVIAAFGPHAFVEGAQRPRTANGLPGGLEARFPAVKSLDTFEFTAIPGLNKMLVLELARSAYVARRENVIALGNSGTGKTHVALALGLAACQRGLSTLFITAHGLAHQLMEARDEKRLLRLQAQLQSVKLLIIDELGYVPLSQVGAELLFEVFSQRYERGSTFVTPNLPFEEWPSVFRSERLTGALLDRLTHHVHILEMNGDSYRLAQSTGRRRAGGAGQDQAMAATADADNPQADPS